MQDLLSIAAQYVNSTGKHVFLTGKAGTGKTTFVQSLAARTHKRTAIVAPTGIAALNAGGVTIHSQFLLPFGSFAPSNTFEAMLPGTVVHDRSTMARRHPLNAARKKVLREIELLIVDEVSMVRADILDAIDYRLRSARRNFNTPFGGVQLLLVGDLFQLPPVVKDAELQALKPFYSSLFFFQSHALIAAGYVHVELDKIFRQSDETFIGLLNQLRENNLTEQGLNILNSHYQEEANSDAITLTTHNRQADEINQVRLDGIRSASRAYEAEVHGDFPESMYPMPQTLVLKEGARVMFVKNDSQGGRYYNGKLAEVLHLEKDQVTVRMDGEEEPFKLGRVTWENIKYEVDDDSKALQESAVGQFIHFPLKLAWAITVHKSQGLTFDKAVIDVGRAFAPGQVYVALSRLRSLDGLILRTKIAQSAISNDSDVVMFSQSKPHAAQLADDLPGARLEYLHTIITQSFELEAIIYQLKRILEKESNKAAFEQDEMQKALPVLLEEVIANEKYAAAFCRQSEQLIHANDSKKLLERAQKAGDYFANVLQGWTAHLLLQMGRAERLSGTKGYLNNLNELDQLLTVKWRAVMYAPIAANALLANKDLPNVNDVRTEVLELRKRIKLQVSKMLSDEKSATSSKSGRVRKAKSKTKKELSETYLTTLGLLNGGFSLSQIAKEREMGVSTIEGHIAKLVQVGKLDPTMYISDHVAEEVAHHLTRDENLTLKALRDLTEQAYTYFEIKVARALFDQNQDGHNN